MTKKMIKKNGRVAVVQQKRKRKKAPIVICLPACFRLCALRLGTCSSLVAVQCRRQIACDGTERMPCMSHTQPTGGTCIADHFETVEGMPKSMTDSAPRYSDRQATSCWLGFGATMILVEASASTPSVPSFAFLLLDSDAKARVIGNVGCTMASGCPREVLASEKGESSRTVIGGCHQPADHFPLHSQNAVSEEGNTPRGTVT
ncbi:hypothetical protein B0T13DRAFT_162562 [Neurospora crassa]|nr:hypothetical protein B0T13DRAFT_162562 [Neurospora crassa]